MPNAPLLQIGKEIGKDASSPKQFSLPLEILKKHFIALGSSGSGKTVLCKAIVEESLLQGIPAILVDTQGDLSSLGLLYKEDEFNDPRLDRQRLQIYNENVEVAVYTPTSKAGIPLCINPLHLDVDHRISYEEMASLISQLSSLLTQLLGYRLNSDDANSAQSIIYLILEQSYKDKKPLGSFTALIAKIQSPDSLLKQKLDAIRFSQKEAELLMKRLHYLTIGEKDLLFNLGVPLDIDTLLGKKDPSCLTLSKKKKTRLSIIYLNTIETSDQKHFFISVLATTLYQWMLSHPSEALQMLFYIDEIAEYIPAGARKPITKEMLKLLFKQARKYGIGLLTSTQNPGDIDYKAFSQFSTWAVGRLTTKQDIKKVQDGLLAATDKSITTETLPKLLATLKPGEFLFFSPDALGNTKTIRTRYLLTKHKTLAEHALTGIVHDQGFSYAEKKSLQKPSLLGPQHMMEVFPLYVEKAALEKEIQKKIRLTFLFKPREHAESVQLLYYPLLKLRLKVRKKQMIGAPKEFTSILYADARLALYQVDEHYRFTLNAGLTPLLGKNLDHEDLDILKILSRYANVSKEDLAKKMKISESIIAKKLSGLEKARMIQKKEDAYLLSFPLNVPSLESLDSPDLKLDSLPLPAASFREMLTSEQQKALESVLPSWFDAALDSTAIVAVPFYKVVLLDRKNTRRTLLFNAVTGKETDMF